MSRKGEIYMMIFPNGKRYIGQTVQLLTKRLTQHFYCDVKNDILLGRAINKYGKHNIKIVTLLLWCDKCQLDYYEVKYIRQYNTRVPCGYNIDKGGSGRLNMSENTKLKISSSLKGVNKTLEHSQNISKGRTGIIFTPEHHKNLSISSSGSNNSHWGVPRTEIQKRTVGDKNRERMLFSRTNPAYTDIPKYIYVRDAAKKGYEVKRHPTLPNKTFVSKKLSMNDKLQLAIEYIKSGNEK